MKKITVIDKSFSPNQTLIMALEAMLDEARKGIITSAVSVTERFNGMMGELIAVSQECDCIKMLGSISLLKHNLTTLLIPVELRK